MKAKRIVKLLLGLGAAATAFGQTYPLSENLWSSPEFQNRVMGSYGAHTELEPKISEEEGLLFKELFVLFEQDLKVGRDRLKASIAPDSSAALDFMLGTIELQLGNLDAAVESYQAAVKKFPNFMRAYKSCGYALTQANRLEEAVEYLVKGLELGGGDGASFGLLGYCYLNMEEYAGALNAYNLAMAYDPDTKDWQMGKVRCLIYMKDYGEAQGLIEDLILKDLDNAELWLHQANAKLAMNQTREVATNLEVVRRMGEASVDSLTLLGDVYANMEMHRLALEAYSDALNREDGRRAVSKARNVARSLIQYEQYDLAKRLAAKVVDRFGSELEPEERMRFLNLQAEIELAQDHTDEAAKILEKIVEEEPMNGEALILLAKHAWTESNIEEAEFLYERAAKVDEVAATALLQHGQMLVQQRSFDDAARLIRRSLDLRYRPQVADYLSDVEEAAQSVF